MKKKLKIILCISMLLLTIGCNQSDVHKQIENQKQLDVIERLPKDYMCLPFQNFNYTIYCTCSNINYFSFPVILSEEIDENEILVDLHINTKYKCSVEKMEADSFPYYLYQCCQKTDWEKLYNYYKEEDKSDYIRYNELYIDEYQNFDESTLPKLYEYRITVALEIDNKQIENEIIEKADIRIGDKLYPYNLGHILIDYGTENDFQDSENVICDTLAISDLVLLPTPTGIINVPDINYTISKNIVLKDIKVYDRSDVAVESATLNIHSKGKDKTIEFKSGEDLPIKAGSKLKLNLTFKDQKLINQMDYESLYYMVLEYEIAGKSYKQKLDISVNIDKSLYENVCEEQGNANLSDYYLKYLCYIDKKDRFSSIGE